MEQKLQRFAYKVINNEDGDQLETAIEVVDQDDPMSPLTPGVEGLSDKNNLRNAFQGLLSPSKSMTPNRTLVGTGSGSQDLNAARDE